MNTRKDVFLKGSKVCLRPYIEKDIEQWYRWFNDELITYWMDKRRFPNTRKKQYEYLENISKSVNDLQLAIVTNDKEDLIGTVGLHDINYINRTADISVIIGEKQYSGKGIGKEAVGLLVEHAFTELNLNKITAGAIEANKASCGLFKSLGFKKEGLLRGQVYLHGDYKNVVKFGLLSKERKK